MPKEFSRTSRLGVQIQKDLAKLIQFDMKDPRLGLVTINDVKVAKDLGYADVYFTVMGAKLDSQVEASESEEEALIQSQTSKILNDAAGFMRSELARSMTTRIVPLLRFHYDPTLLQGHKMTRLIGEAMKVENNKPEDQ